MRRPASPQRRAAALIGAALVCGAATAALAGPLPSSRLRVAVMPFLDIGTTKAGSLRPEPFADQITGLLSARPEFELIERGRLESLMAEMKFQRTGAVDLRTAASLGRQLGAEFLLLGAYQVSNKQVQLHARLVDVDDGAVAFGATVHGPVAELARLREELAGRLAEAIGASVIALRRVRERPFSRERLRSMTAFVKAEELAMRRAWRDAIPLFEEAIRLDGGFADAYFDLAAVYKELGDPARALTNVERAKALVQAAGNGRRVVDALLEIGDLMTRLGKPEEAESPLREGLALAKKSGSKTQESVAEGLLGRAALDRDALREARRHYARSLELHRAIGKITNQLAIEQNLGLVALLNDDDDALELQEELLRKARAESEWSMAAAIRQNTGNFLLKREEWRLALDHYREGLALAGRNPGAEADVVNLNWGAGVACEKLGRQAEALEHLTLALSLGERKKKWAETFGIAGNLAQTYQSLGRVGDAADAIERGLKAGEALGLRGPEMAWSYRIAARVRAEAGRRAAAVDAQERAVGLAQLLRLPYLAEARRELEAMRRAGPAGRGEGLGNLDILFKDRVAVLDFLEVVPQSGVEGRITQRLAAGGDVTLVERGRIDEVMKELALSGTGLVSAASAAEAGRLLGATLVVLGSADRSAGDFSLELRIVRVETGRVIATVSRRSAAASENMTIDAAAKSLGRSLRGATSHFPSQRRTRFGPTAPD